MDLRGHAVIALGCGACRGSFTRPMYVLGVFNIVASIMILSAPQHLWPRVSWYIENGNSLHCCRGQYALAQAYRRSSMR